MIITEDEIRQEVLNSIAQNRVMLFMKGTPEMPRCGFSMQTVACLKDTGAEFAAMDILPDPRIRQLLSPTGLLWQSEAVKRIAACDGDELLAVDGVAHG